MGEVDDEVLMEDREQFPELYKRKCMNHDTLTLQGFNLGDDPKQLKVWVVAQSLLKGSEGTKVIFDVFNGTKYTTNAPDGSVLNRGYGGCDEKFCFQYSHNKLVVRGPSGYGQDSTLYINVQGQEINTPFSFYSPMSPTAVFLDGFPGSPKPKPGTATRPLVFEDYLTDAHTQSVARMARMAVYWSDNMLSHQTGLF